MLVILLIIILICLAICYGIYRFAFYSPNKTQNNDLAVSSTPQMNERRQKIISMIEASRSVSR